MTRGVETLGNLGLLLRIMLILFLACTAIMLAMQTVILWPGMPFGYEVYLFFSASVSLLSLLNILLFALGVALTAIWTYRAHANLAEANLIGCKYSPRRAAASYFVPFANLVVPYKAMRDLHNRSLGEDEWQADTEVSDVAIWQICAIGALLIAIVGAIMAFFVLFTNAWVTMPQLGYVGLSWIYSLFTGGATWCLFRLIGKITRYQSDGLHFSQSDVFA